MDFSIHIWEFPFSLSFGVTRSSAVVLLISILIPENARQVLIIMIHSWIVHHGGPRASWCKSLCPDTMAPSLMDLVLDPPRYKLSSSLIDPSQLRFTLSIMTFTNKIIFLGLVLGMTNGFNTRRHDSEKKIEEIRDILLTVKTTAKNHKTRVKLLLDTWDPEALQNVSCLL